MERRWLETQDDWIGSWPVSRFKPEQGNNFNFLNDGPGASRSIKHLPKRQAVRRGAHPRHAPVLCASMVLIWAGGNLPRPDCTIVPTMPRHIL